METRMGECDEAYKDCVAARKARVKKVLETAEPWETVEEIAEKAAVSPRTVKQAKATLLQTGQACTDCNSSPVKPVNLRDLYGHDDKSKLELSFDHPNVRRIENALERCSRVELAYVICELIPFFEKGLKARLEAERRKQNGKSSGTASLDHAAHAAE